MATEKKIEQRFLGDSGEQVPIICLGAMTLSSTQEEHSANGWGLPTVGAKRSIELLDYAVENGVNFIDTADVYGSSEDIIGKWLASKPEGFRAKLTIATKVGAAGGLTRTNIMSHVTASLKRLQTSYIDLYQCHVYDGATSLSKLCSTMNDLIKSGKVRFWGVSNWLPSDIERAIAICEKHGFDKPVSLQPQYSLIARGIEHELVEVCKRNKMAILPWSPLAGGWLSGRYSRNDAQAESKEAEKGSRVEWAQKFGWKETNFDRQATEKTWKTLDTLEAIAKEVDASVAQVALRWVAQKAGVTSVIVGARKLEHLKSNIASAQVKLSPAHMKALDDVSFEEPPYPHSVAVHGLLTAHRRKVLL